MIFIKESIDNSDYIIHYDSLNIDTRDGNYDIEYDYNPNKDSISEHIADYLEEDKDSIYISLESSEDVYNYIEDNFDKFFNKYYDRLKKDFRNSAEEYAFRNYDFSDYE